MPTAQDLFDDLEQAIVNTNKSNDDQILVFKNDENTPVTLRDGTVVESLDARVKKFRGDVKSVVGKTGEVTANDIYDALGLGTSSQYNYEDLPISNEQKKINDKTLSEVESIADLVEIKNPKDNQVIFLKSHSGHHLGSDNFIFIKSSTLSNDNGRVIKPKYQDEGRWIRLNRDINIEQYGAIPLSIEDFDSTSAIEQCALSNTGKQVNVPADKYKITRTFDASLNCCFRGANGSSVYELKSEFIIDSLDVITLFPLGVKVQLENMCVSGGEYGITPLHTLATKWDNYGSIPMRNCRIRRFANLGTITTTYMDFYDVFISECIDTFFLSQNYANESSTVIGFHSCRFTYSQKGIQAILEPNSTMPPTVGVYFVNCGFENIQGYGIYGELYAVSVRDCWFENVTGKYNVTSSTVIQETNVSEYFTGESVGVNPALFSNINGIYSQLPKLRIHDSLSTPRISSDSSVTIDNGVRFKDGYIEGGNSNIEAEGEAIQQKFTSDGGGVSASLQFLRTSQGGSGVFHGSAISFKTGRLTDFSPDPSVEQWRIDSYGHLLPKGTNVNIGSNTDRVNKVSIKQLSISELDVYSDNTSAKNGGLLIGDVYRTDSGRLMIVF